MAEIPEYEDPLEFAALIAHQLKSPVGAAGSILKTVLAEYAGRLSPRQKDLLDRADLRLQQALNTVGRMLTILRPESVEGSGKAYCDASSVVHRRLRRHAEEASALGVALETDVQVASAYVRISEPALSEALEALLTNALKYTPSRGVVRVRICNAPEKDDRIRISVADSGIGISEADREKVFEPFFRSAKARDTAVAGTGLGLAFVKAVVDQSGGQVSVDRADLGGANFVVELERVSESELAIESAADVSDRLKVVIIGGVAAGPKVASKVIRLKPDTDVTIIEKDSFLSYAGCGFPYYVSGVVADHKELMASSLGAVRDPVFFQNVKNVKVLSQTEALEIDRAGKRVLTRSLRDGQTTWRPYDKLVLATGSVPKRPPLPGIDLHGIFTLHGMRDAEGIRNHLAGGKARDVVIVGGGLIGVEMTEALAERGCRVTIIEKLPQILKILDPEIARLVEQHMEARGVRILTDTSLLAFEGDGHVSQVVADRDPVPADMILLAIGVRPNVGLASKAGLDIGETGAIKVDDHMQTSDPDIYAAGDCVESVDIVTGRPYYFPLGSKANKEGRIAALSLCDAQESFPGVVGSCACKVFDYCVARTGLTENEAVQAGLDVASVLLPSLDREHFIPGAQYLMFKLVVEKGSRRVLGAQCVGAGHGDKRIDVVATAITGRLTVDQLANLDLCYAPSYSLAIDSVLVAANAVKNKLDGHMDTITSAEVNRRLQNKDGIILVDVSSTQENEEVRIPGALSIPLGTLRGRLGELPRDKEIVTFCRISLRAYEAAIILKAEGFERVRVMEGGMQMWPYDKVIGR